SGRGTVVTGRIERGVVKVGDEVEIVGLRPTMKTTCTGVEMFRKLLDQGQAGDNVGVLLRGTKREEVERGQVLAKPGSITPHTKFECEVYILTKEEGGRHTPFFKGYKPQFYFRTTDVTGSIELPEGTEMVMPGDNIKMTVDLIAPIAMEEGLRFAIREGGRTVGAGVAKLPVEFRTRSESFTDSKADSGSTAFDTVKLVRAGAILVAGLAGHYYYAELPTIMRVVIVLVSMGAAAFVALQSAQGQALSRFIQASRVELRKVVWPTREETIQTTVAVLIFTAVMGVFFWLLDLSLLTFTRWIMGQGG